MRWFRNLLTRNLLVVACAMIPLVLIGPAATAQTQSYPTRPVRIIAASSAGGISDIYIRSAGEEMQKRWGQPLIIENRPGGSFNIAARACADAQPDGYTLCLIASDVLLYNRVMQASLSYDLFKDLEPVTTLFKLIQGVFVSSKLNVSTLDQLAAYAKANPKTLSYSSASIPHQLLMDDFNAEYGTDIVRVPFRGGGDAVNGVLSGTTPISIVGLGNFAPHITAGTVKGIALDAQKRSPLFPYIPILREVRPNQAVTQADFSLFAPKGTPRPILDKVAADFTAMMRDPALLDRFITQRGLEPVFNKPDEFAADLRQEMTKVEQIAKKANLKPQ